MTKDKKQDKKSSSLLATFSRQPVEIKAGILTLLAASVSVPIPNFIVEKLIVSLGIPNFIPAAMPPIGYVGRAVIALMTGFVGGIGAYFYFTGKGSWKQRRRFESKMQNSVQNEQPEKSFVDRLRRGYNDTLAPKATEWDANPADASFKPLDVERDLGARFDDSPYLSDANRSYLEDVQPVHEENVFGHQPVTPIPAPVHAELPELELDPASKLSDPQWRVRPVEALRETTLDLGTREEIGITSHDHINDTKAAAPEAEIDYIAMRKNRTQDAAPAEIAPAWLKLGLDTHLGNPVEEDMPAQLDDDCKPIDGLRPSAASEPTAVNIPVDTLVEQPPSEIPAESHHVQAAEPDRPLPAVETLAPTVTPPSAPAAMESQVPVAPKSEIVSPKAETDSSVNVLLARLEGALVERASRRAQMRLENEPSSIAPGLEKAERDMSGTLKEALAALQNASRSL